MGQGNCYFRGVGFINRATTPGGVPQRQEGPGMGRHGENWMAGVFGTTKAGS